MDPAGIFMLKSVYDKFDSLRINPQVEMKCMNDASAIIGAIKKGIYPVVLARYTYGKNPAIAHAMVASNVLEKTNFGSKIEYFLECKNSYRDDNDEPGKFQH